MKTIVIENKISMATFIICQYIAETNARNFNKTVFVINYFFFQLCEISLYKIDMYYS